MPPDLTATLTEIAEALTAVLQSDVRLLELNQTQLAILRRMAETLDNLTAWLQAPPSSDLSDSLRSLVAKVDAIKAKVDIIDARTEVMADRIDQADQRVLALLDRVI
jgi:hypothetical protein